MQIEIHLFTAISSQAVSAVNLKIQDNQGDFAHTKNQYF